MKRVLNFGFIFILMGCQTVQKKSEVVSVEDPYLWLEEIESSQSLDFVNKENQKTLTRLKSDPQFSAIELENRQIILAKDRTPNLQIRDGLLYNFWQDETHVRGIWRRTTIASFSSGKPHWEVLLDLDLLAVAEKENWVWKGSRISPDNAARTLLFLSRGGKDASVMREYDLKNKSFVVDGFNLAESKGGASWVDVNTVFVSTDFGPESMTTSGYPRITKRWTRGTPLDQAVEVNRVNPVDMGGWTFQVRRPEGKYVIHLRQIGFYESEKWIEIEGRKVLLPLPLDSSYEGIFSGRVLFSLRSDLEHLVKGSLVALPLSKIENNPQWMSDLEVVFKPTDKKFLESVMTTKNHLILTETDNIVSKIVKVDLLGINDWVLEELTLGSHGMSSISAFDSETDQYLAQHVDFLNPVSTYLANAGERNHGFTLLTKSPQRFRADDLEVQRLQAVSADGTVIPYFVVSKKSLKMDQKNPTLIYGYGGFELSMQPSYLGAFGKVWLERGGVYVLSNLRGGGEFGPLWHQSVVRENRYKVYEDNIAIAEDLIKRGITSPAHLGIKGGSNGGLLVGATFVLRPDLFNAVLCQVPLLDMLRYHKLLAGASWMNEYGNPEEEGMRAQILRYSPYQLVKKDVKYPEVFFMTSTQDDRVHPGHARKMVAKMKDQGHAVLYYENRDGGHGRTANLEQSVLWSTLEATYLWEKLGRDQN